MLKQNIFKIILTSFLLSILFLHVKAQTKADATIKQLVQDWNNAHAGKDTSAFSHLYGNHILYYGSRITKDICIEKKVTFLSKNPTYTQQIAGTISMEAINKEEWECNFTKRIQLKTETKDFPSYLIFRKEGTQWKIVTEGDLVTDQNLAKKATNQGKMPKDAVSGDYNGDGKKEYMWLTEPKMGDKEMECAGACDCYIKFSDPGIPSIKIENCIGGTPENKGDLNKNGTDEVGLLPSWFTSCWAAYHVWTFIKGNWVNAVEPFSTHCDQWEDNVIPIEIDPKREGYVIIRYSEFKNDNIKTKMKSVKIVR